VQSPGNRETSEADALSIAISGRSVNHADHPVMGTAIMRLDACLGDQFPALTLISRADRSFPALQVTRKRKSRMCAALQQMLALEVLSNHSLQSQIRQFAAVSSFGQLM
jgi:hypothetical protein